jgi:2-methylcitrate dehydratase PrpD
LIALIKHHSIEPDNVESIDCATTPLVVASLPYSNPHDVSQARFSMQFCLAVAALGRGEIKVDDFREERLRDPRVQGMMKRVTLRVAPEFETKGFAPPDGPEAAVVEVRIKGGERYSTRRAFADWRPDHLPSMEALTKKYRDCASSTLSKRKVQGSIEVIQGLDRLDRIHKLITWLVP